MQKIIKDNQIIEDNWLLLPVDSSMALISDDNNLIVPLSLWKEHKLLLIARTGQTGVWLKAEQEIEEIVEDLINIPLIALEFPEFTIGCHYSSARILRDRYHYQGEIRAIGDVLRDQLFAMMRCGINSFALKADKSIELALQGLTDFSVTYQGATDQPQPLFNRRRN